MNDDSSFASRWSRRKQAVKDEVSEDEQDIVEEIVEEEPEKTDEEILTEFNLKDPDQMEAGDDFSKFMNEAIPQRLRNRALRKLWLSNPALANLDNLLEYGEDFTDKGAAVEEIVTAYKVGKGFINDLIEDEEDKSESYDDWDGQSSDQVEKPQEIESAEPINSVRAPAEVRVKAPLPVETDLGIVTEKRIEAAKTRKRRMNFKF